MSDTIKELNGIIIPLVTPLDYENNIDKKSLKKLIDYCIEGGAAGIFVLGSCGEGSILSTEKKKEVVRYALEYTKEKVPLLVGVLESSSEKVLGEIKSYEELGAAYFVSTVPYYISPGDQEEILKHYRFLAENIKGKLIAYNIPSYTHCDIMPDTMKKLLEISNLIAVKDSTDRWDLFQKALFLNKTGGIISGNEDLCGAALLFGAEGCVPCLANAYPKFYSKLYMYAKEKNIKKVIQYQEIIIKIKNVLNFAHSWIAAVKYLCARKGLINPYMSYGIAELSQEEVENIEKYLAENETLFTKI